jgi:hypothetical protein
VASKGANYHAQPYETEPVIENIGLVRGHRLTLNLASIAFQDIELLQLLASEQL